MTKYVGTVIWLCKAANMAARKPQNAGWKWLFISTFPSHITNKHYVSPSFSTYEAFVQYACTHNSNIDACEGGNTCDFKPHRNIRGFGGDDAHHMRHRVAFHDRKHEGRLLKKQGSCISWQFRFGNPLDMQTTSWRFLRTSIVDSFNLWEAGNERLCYTM